MNNQRVQMQKCSGGWMGQTWGKYDYGRWADGAKLRRKERRMNGK